MRLTEAEFWQCTPRQFQALLLRRASELRRWDILAGILAAAIHNFSGFAKQAMSPKDFIPWLEMEAAEPTPEETADELERMFSNL